MCPENKRKTWWYQSYRWFKTSVRDHTRAQMAFIAIYGTLLIEEAMIYNLRYCRLKLFVYGWWDSHVNFLDPYKEHWTFNKLIIAISSYKQTTTTATMIRITWRLFFVCSSCLFTFSLSRAHTYLPISTKILANILHLSFSMKLTFSARKCHQNVVTKSTELVDIIGFALNNA